MSELRVGDRVRLKKARIKLLSDGSIIANHDGDVGIVEGIEQLPGGRHYLVRIGDTVFRSIEHNTEGVEA
jgi:hypothetical protein